MDKHVERLAKGLRDVNRELKSMPGWMQRETAAFIEAERREAAKASGGSSQSPLRGRKKG